MNSLSVLFALFIFLSSEAFAQTSSAYFEIQKAVQAIAQKQVDACLEKKIDCSVTGDTLVNLEPPRTTDSTQNIDCVNCNTVSQTPTPAPTGEKKTETRVLLVSSLNANFLPQPTQTRYPNVLPKDFIDKAVEIRPYFGSDDGFIDYTLSFVKEPYRVAGRRSLITSMLMQNARNLTNGDPKISDHELGSYLASEINHYAKNFDEKMGLLAAISERLNFVYNDKRNPLANKNHDPIPRGNMRLSQMMSAANNWDTDNSGVCNDISQAIAVIATELFPDQDVLVINNGSHYGTLINDKKTNTHHIINWDRVDSNQGELSLGALLPVTNTRILKMKNDKLQEIAVTDTEVGAVFNQLFGSPRPSLQTGVDPSVVYASFEKEYENRMQRKVTLEAKAAIARTSQAQLLVFVGQRTVESKRTRFDMGYAGAFQQFDSGDQAAIFALHEKFDLKAIRYVGPGVTIKGTSSAQSEVEFAKTLKKSGKDIELNETPAFSVNFQAIQKLEVETHPKNSMRPQFSGSAQLIHALGTTDEGARQGSSSDPGLKGAMNMLSHVRFHLNQVVGDGNLSVPLTPTLSAKTNANYQGSNIGQKIDVSSGIEVKSAGGMKIYMFLGYVDSSIQGYQTQGSLLTSRTGMQGGVRFQSASGTQVSGQIQGLGPSNRTLGSVNLSIPIKPKAKKNRSFKIPTGDAH